MYNEGGEKANGRGGGPQGTQFHHRIENLEKNITGRWDIDVDLRLFGYSLRVPPFLLYLHFNLILLRMSPSTRA